MTEQAGKPRDRPGVAVRILARRFRPGSSRAVAGALRRRAGWIALAAAVGLAGFVQPVAAARFFAGEWMLDPLRSLATAAFFLAVLGLLALLYNLFARYTPRLRAGGGYRDMVFAREAPMALAIARIAICVSLSLASLRYIGFIYEEGLLVDPAFAGFGPPAFPKLIDRLLPFRDIGANAWRMVILAVGALAVLGVASRFTFALAWLIPLYLVSHYEAWTPSWSHGEAPILLCAIPFLLRDLRGRFYLPIGGRAPGASPFFPIFVAQLLLALFYFGAFYAKMGLAGLAWVTTDHLANSLDFAWSRLAADYPKPAYVAWVQQHPILVRACALGHVLMQAIPILVLFSPGKPWARLFEGAVFAFGVVLLWAFMGYLWPWYWWLPIAVVFVDWDYFLGRVRFGPRVAAISPRTWYGVLLAYPVAYFAATASQVIPDRLDLYPFFDDLTFYAQPHAAWPYDGRTPYYMKRGGLAPFVPACGVDPACIFGSRVFGSNKNSAPLQLLRDEDGSRTLDLLARCRRAGRGFCDEALDRAPGVVNWYGLFRTSAGRGLQLEVAAYRAIDAPGLQLAVTDRSDEIRFVGRSAADIESADLWTMGADRSGLELTRRNVPADQLDEALGERCLGIAHLHMRDGAVLPFVVRQACNWRRAVKP